MKVQESEFIQEKKPLLKKLLEQLLERYAYGSVLALFLLGNLELPFPHSLRQYFAGGFRHLGHALTDPVNIRLCDRAWGSAGIFWTVGCSALIRSIQSFSCPGKKTWRNAHRSCQYPPL